MESSQKQVATIARSLLTDADTGLAARITRIRQERALDRYIQGDSSLVYVCVLDAAGIGAFSGLDLRGDARLQERLKETFTRVQEGNAVMSTPLVSEALQEPVLVLGEPILAAGKVQGEVLAVVRLAGLRQIMRDVGARDAVEVYVTDSSGHLVAHSDHGKPLSADVSSVEIVRLFLESQQGNGATVPFTISGQDGPRRMVGTYVHVPDSLGWGVIVQADEASATLPASDDHDAAARQLIEVMGVSTSGSKLIDQLFETFKRRFPAIPPAVWDDARAQLASEEFVALQAAVYKKHFSLDEVRALLVFFQSPIGQRYLQEQPGLIEDAMAIGQEVTRRTTERLRRCLQQHGYSVG
jgi:hypothetical protein